MLAKIDPSGLKVNSDAPLNAFKTPISIYVFTSHILIILLFAVPANIVPFGLKAIE